MAAQSNDEQLTRWANNAGRMIFSPATESQKARALSGATSFPWCYRKGSAWIVKFSCRGKLYRIGKFSDPVNATRFADLAIIRFWKYQDRGAKSLATDRHLTHGRESAERDARVNLGVIILLENIEARLLSIGAFQPPTPINEQTQQPNRPA